MTRPARPARIAGYRVSADVAALNAEQVEGAARAASTDTADLLVAEAERLRSEAPEAAAYLLSLTREHRFHPTRRWRLDFADEAQRLGIEIDGGFDHARGGRHATDGDYAKRRALTALGWRLIAFRAAEVRSDPLRVLREIWEAGRC